LTTAVETKDAETGFIFKVKNRLGDQRPGYCYQCGKCTSGCPVAKLQPEYRPHQIVSMVQLGLVKELFTVSDLVWSCALCLKCKEVCPQDVAPVDLLLALRNIGVERGVPVPQNFHRVMIGSIARCGYYQPAQMVRSRDRKFYDRERLALPSISKPKDIKAFAAAIEKILKRC